MWTTLDLNPALILAAMKASGVKTKTAAVTRGLEALVNEAARMRLVALRGKIPQASAGRRSRLESAFRLGSARTDRATQTSWPRRRLGGLPPARRRPGRQRAAVELRPPAQRRRQEAAPCAVSESKISARSISTIVAALTPKSATAHPLAPLRLRDCQLPHYRRSLPRSL